ncbi:MAG: cell division protein SepF [Actinomycetota bacterium]|nr:cell division protein SepF [Actinomycetota bacterium]
MGSWRKVGAFFGLSPDEEHHYEGDGYDAAPYEGGDYEPVGRNRDGHENSGQAGGGYQGGGYGGNEYEEAGYDRAVPDHAPGAHPAGAYPVGGYRSGGAGSTPAPAGAAGRSAKRSFSSEPITQGALAMQADQRRDVDSSTASRPASVKLTGFGEARIVGEKYRDGQSVILDMTGMSDGDARRLVDFSAGLAFSLRGSIEKVAPKVFMLLPAEADIAGGAANALEDARAYVGAYAHR